MGKPLWHGVYPAATTQFAADLSLDLPAYRRTVTELVNDGVDGLILLGTVGENNSLRPEEKRVALRAAIEAVGGRVPLVAGVSEFTTERAIEYVRDAEKLGVDAFMLLPAMVYVPTDDELCAHFRLVAAATRLPIMLYNNPPAYRVNIELETLAKLADVPNIVAIKESAPDPRRFTDIINRFGDRFTLMAGLDDVALEGFLLGATGWVSGLTSAFPRESVAMVAAARRGIRIDMARLQERLGLPVVGTIAVRRGGTLALIERLDREVVALPSAPEEHADLHAEVRALIAETVSVPSAVTTTRLPSVTGVVVSTPAARTPAIAAPSAPAVSLARIPVAATLSSAPSWTLPLSAVAVGTSSTMLMSIVPVAVLPLASVTT